FSLADQSASEGASGARSAAALDGDKSPAQSGDRSPHSKTAVVRFMCRAGTPLQRIALTRTKGQLDGKTVNLPRSALRRPFTVVVAVIGVVWAAALAWRPMPQDVLPALNLPTIYVAQTYGGMDPAQMEGYLVYFFEYHFLYLTGIEHVESKSIQGAALMKLQFHPGTDMAQAMAETVAYVNRARAFMPPGTVPPLITRFDAGSVPTGYLVFSSDTRSITEMQDAALNCVRPLFATLQGVSAPPPFGGNARSIVVNLKPERLKSYHMSPDEVAQAIAEA